MKRGLPIVVAAGAMFFGSALSAQEPQQVVFATYYRCTQGQEARADEIVRDVFGPMFDRHVSAGRLVTWGLNAHVMGSGWRRLMYSIGTDRDVMFDRHSRPTTCAIKRSRNARTAS
jgi:hypothetical protein